MTATANKADAPWAKPTLKKSPELVIDSLRETQQMINSLQDKAKKMKAEIDQMYRDGEMAHLVDDENSDKYNGHGCSVTLCSGKKTRLWESAVQMELDKIQSEMDRVKLKAEAARKYTDKEGPKYWRLTMQKEL